VLAKLAEELGANIHANHHHEPWWKAAEAELGDRLALHHGITLVPPDGVRSRTGTRYRIFTPFARALEAQLPPADPVDAPERIDSPPEPAGDRLADWRLLPTRPNWATGFEGSPGEAGARATLEAFLPNAHDYGTGRNLPSAAGTSRLSAHLHWGEISPARAWRMARDAHGEAADAFTRQIVWRDFALNLLDQFPDSHAKPHRAQFERFPFRDAPDELEAWKRGLTGYPIVDAGMRQLWRTGWMHNRVRMIASSFLVKHLLIDWREGERFFWDTLVDADAANNALGWQWIMGSGVDSSPFGRIIAPIAQSEKWDAAGYIRENVPELANLPDGAIHAPFDADANVLERAGVRLGGTYPVPLVGHAEARTRAMAAYAGLKR
jgi:deoxyribodipyrimidine photo-lyase